MTTKPKPKPAGQVVAERIAKERQELLEAADEALLRLAAGEEMSDADSILFSSLDWDRKKIEGETGRCAGVRRFQARAGTSDERNVAEDRAANATAELDAQRPEIEKQIDLLRTKLERLETEKADAARIVQDQQAAVKTLRELAPPYIKQLSDRRRGAAKERINPRCAKLEGRLRVIESISSLATEGRPVVQYARNVCPELLRCRQSGEPIGVDPDGWAVHVEELQAESERLRPEFERLRDELQVALDDAETLLDCYAR